MSLMSKYFINYQLPTERPRREAAREYRHRAVVISIVFAAAAAAALLLALAIMAVQAGYWYIVAIALLVLIFDLFGGGGGSPPQGSKPPNQQGNTGMHKKSDEGQSVEDKPEMVLVPARRPKRKSNILARRTDHTYAPTVVIEKEINED